MQLTLAPTSQKSLKLRERNKMPLLSMKPCCSNLDGMRVDTRQAIDRIQAMKQQEHQYNSLDYFSVYIDTDSRSTLSDLSPSTKNTTPQRADVQCRMKMCEWCYQVVDYFKFNRETVQISMSYLDRFLATSQGRPYLGDRSGFQLVSIACLYLAIKVHEPMELDMLLLAELSRGCCSVAQITNMEKVILDALQWRMNPPTIGTFVQHIFALLPSSVPACVRKSLMDVAHYQTELAIFDYGLSVTSRPSAIATAAVINAMEGMDAVSFSSSLKNTCLSHMSTMIGFTSCMDGVPECRKRLMRYLRESPVEIIMSAPKRSQPCDLVRQKSSTRSSMGKNSPVAIHQ